MLSRRSCILLYICMCVGGVSAVFLFFDGAEFAYGACEGVEVEVGG